MIMLTSTHKAVLAIKDAKIDALNRKIAQANQKDYFIISKELQESLDRIGGRLRVESFNEMLSGDTDFSCMIVQDEEPGCAAILAQQMSDQMAEDFVMIVSTLRSALALARAQGKAS